MNGNPLLSTKIPLFFDPVIGLVKHFEQNFKFTYFLICDILRQTSYVMALINGINDRRWVATIYCRQGTKDMSRW